MLEPNFYEAARFLDLLAPGETEFTFQTVVDNKEEAEKPNVKRELNRVFHGTLENLYIKLGGLNIAGAGIFVMINRGDGIVLPGRLTCRSNANVIAVRAIFVDLDGAPLDPVLNHKIPPDIVIESSPGKWHAYWLAKDCPLGEFSGLQESIAELFNGDRAVKDLARVMRLPGFYHQKREPFMTRIVYPKGNE